MGLEEKAKWKMGASTEGALYIQVCVAWKEEAHITN